MRIAYVITRSDTLCGAHIHVRDLAASLLKQGHDVRVLTGGVGAFTRELDDLGIPFQSLRFLSRTINLREDVRSLLELRGVLKALRPDLVSTHSRKAGWLGRIAARSLGIPVLFTAHGWSFAAGMPRSSATILKLAELCAGRLANRIVTVSEYDQAVARRAHIAPADRIVVIHNGMPDVAVNLRATPDREPPRLVMVARFENQKDHATLFHALDRLSHLPWSLELIGDGPDMALWERRVAAESWGDRVKFVGLRHDVAERLANAQLLLLVSNWEGFPRSILEAMRAGLPVIASDVGGTREAVEDGSTGYLVPRGDVSALTDRLLRLLSDAELRSRMGAAGRARFEDEFRFEHMLQRTVDLYASIITRRKHAWQEGAIRPVVPRQEVRVQRSRAS